MEIGTHERTDYTGRAEDHRKLISITHIVNAAGLCLFGYISFDARSIPDFMASVTGWDVTMDELLETGERIGTVRHMFNLREGVNPLEFKVPGLVLGKPPLKAGNVRDITVDENTMIEEYLELMDWDTATTRPSDAKLKALGLEDMI
jgi:aldehyde:ferredoxin oxidoreductase